MAQRMTMQERTQLGEWLAVVMRRLDDEGEREAASPAKLSELATAGLGRPVTRANIVTAAADRGIALPKGRPGRPRTRDDLRSTLAGTAALATEVRRLCRVLDIEPVDPAALDRIAAGA